MGVVEEQEGEFAEVAIIEEIIKKMFLELGITGTESKRMKGPCENGLT